MVTGAPRAAAIVGQRDVLDAGPLVARLRVQAHELADGRVEVVVDRQAEGTGEADAIGKSWVQRPSPRVVATSRARSCGRWRANSPVAKSMTWRWALALTSARISVWSSTSLTSLRATAARIDAAAICPIWGSIGPRTADGLIEIRSAANAMSVPPLIA